ncbi:MAG: hypothetical protein ACP5HU_12455 [Phycisphaerae bacterium]
MRDFSLILVLTLLGLAAGSCAAEDAEPLAPQDTSDPAAAATSVADPQTYDDEGGFQRRSEQIIRALATVDLGSYRRGYFTGGDPGKYMPLHAMARLKLDPDDDQARKYLNDGRAPTQHYHFAAVNWARLIPEFSGALEPQTLETFTQKARERNSYISTSGRGTENHHVMQLTSGVVLPDYLDTDRFAGTTTARARAQAKQWLRWYVRNLYHYGQSEWDSSTYMMFDVNGMLNIYDFSKDPECRLLARAALDWYATTLALKYVNGMHTGPKERGWTDEEFDSIADMTCWLWWGSTGEPEEDTLRGARYTMHPITSSWRPNRVISNIARRRADPLPAEYRNAKPNYWHGLDKPPIEPVANVSQESLYITEHYTLGTMWWAEDVCTQLTRMQLGAGTDDGAVAFTGSAPGTYNGQPRYKAGQGTHIVRKSMQVDPQTIATYVQYAQVGPTVVCMAAFPVQADEKFTYFSTPVEFIRFGRWRTAQAGNTFIGVLPLTGTVEDRRLGDMPAMVFPGERSGFVLQTADVNSFDSLAEFGGALEQLEIDLSEWTDSMKITTETMDGRNVTMQYRRGRDHADVSIDGEEVSYEDWAEYDGPHVRQSDGVLKVFDGTDGFVIDFSGQMPVYRPWNPTETR